jgi:hypothetical protein
MSLQIFVGFFMKICRSLVIFWKFGLFFGRFKQVLGGGFVQKRLRSKIFLVATDNCTGFSVLFAYF